jgi:hypothetical protein
MREKSKNKTNKATCCRHGTVLGSESCCPGRRTLGRIAQRLMHNLQQRQTKRSCFACSSLCSSHHVSSTEDERNAFSLVLKMRKREHKKEKKKKNSSLEQLLAAASSFVERLCKAHPTGRAPQKTFRIFLF